MWVLGVRSTAYFSFNGYADFEKAPRYSQGGDGWTAKRKHILDIQKSLTATQIPIECYTLLPPGDPLRPPGGFFLKYLRLATLERKHCVFDTAVLSTVFPRGRRMGREA